MVTLVKGYGAPQAVPNVVAQQFNSSWEFMSAIADTMEGKTFFAESNHMINCLLPQPINVPTSIYAPLWAHVLDAIQNSDSMVKS
jgi:hypothetical protein